MEEMSASHAEALAAVRAAKAKADQAYVEAVAALEVKVDALEAEIADARARLAHAEAASTRSTDDREKTLVTMEASLAREQAAREREAQHRREAEEAREAAQRQLAEAEIALTEAKTAAKATASEAKERARKAKAAAAEAERGRDAVQAELSTARAELAKAKEETQRAVQEAERTLKRKLKTATAKADEAAAALTAAESRRAAAEAQLRKVEVEASSKASVTTQQRRRLQQQEEACARLEKDLANTKATHDREMKRLKADVAASEQAAKREAAALAAARKTLASLERQKVVQADELRQRGEAAASLDAQVQDLDTQLVQKQKLLAEARSKQAATEETVAELERRIREMSESLVFERTERLLERVSDKDARIALLEQAGAKRHAAELEVLRREHAEDVRALKEQFARRAALAIPDGERSADGSFNMSGDPHAGGNGMPEVDAAVLADQLENRETEIRRLRKYIDQLLGEILKQTERISAAIMTGLPRLQQDEARASAEVQAMAPEQLRAAVKKRDKDVKSLEVYIDMLLQRIVEHRPSILEVMSFSAAEHA